jgi:hypothetical protein
VRFVVLEQAAIGDRGIGAPAGDEALDLFEQGAVVHLLEEDDPLLLGAEGEAVLGAAASLGDPLGGADFMADSHPQVDPQRPRRVVEALGGGAGEELSVLAPDRAGEDVDALLRRRGRAEIGVQRGGDRGPIVGAQVHADEVGQPGPDGGRRRGAASAHLDREDREPALLVDADLIEVEHRGLVAAQQARQRRFAHPPLDVVGDPLPYQLQGGDRGGAAEGVVGIGGEVVASQPDRAEDAAAEPDRDRPPRLGFPEVDVNDVVAGQQLLDYAVAAQLAQPLLGQAAGEDRGHPHLVELVASGERQHPPVEVVDRHRSAGDRRQRLRGGGEAGEGRALGGGKPAGVGGVGGDRRLGELVELPPADLGGDGEESDAEVLGGPQQTWGRWGDGAVGDGAGADRRRRVQHPLEAGILR